MTEERGGARRLDSWKSIAAYLNRDERTVRRWERELGLPIRRVPGGQGRSVFAYAAEVDEWLRGRELDSTASNGSSAGEIGTAGPERSSAPTTSSRVWRSAAVRVAAIAVLILGTASAWAYAHRGSAAPPRIAVTQQDVTAIDEQGDVRWRYTFPADFGWALPGIGMPEPSRIVGGARPATYVATSFKVRHSDEQAESGEVMEFSRDGKLERTFSFDDTVSLGGTTYRAPWAITSFAIDESTGKRWIAVTGHHYVWNPGMVTILDDQFHRAGTFVHDGWIETVRWLAPNRLLIAGYSNTYGGGMAALLDPTAATSINGQGPEAPGTPRFCTSCSTGAPLRMVIMPRSDLNRAVRAPFNRVVVQVYGDRILLRTIEVPAVGPRAPADAIYEFTPALDPVSARYGDGYLDAWRALDSARTRPRGAPASADLRPTTIRRWEPASGWTTVKVP